MEKQGWIRVHDKGGATKDFFRGDFYIFYPEYHHRDVHRPHVELGGDGTVPFVPLLPLLNPRRKEY